MLRWCLLLVLDFAVLGIDDVAVVLLGATRFGVLAGVKWLVRAPDFAFTLDRAARGLGKTLWWGPFKIQFYGLRAGA